MGRLWGTVWIFEQCLVTVVEDTRIVLVVRLPTSLRTARGPSSPAFHTLDDSTVAAQDVNASCSMKPNINQ